MKQHETWELYKKGKDAWNAWAKEMLAKRKALEKGGKWGALINASGVIEGQNDETRNWLSRVSVVFGNYSEDSYPDDLSGLIFPGDLWARNICCTSMYVYSPILNNTEFFGVVHFDAADFGRNVQLNGAIFYSDVVFSGAKFDSPGFEGTKFHGIANFANSRFASKAMFSSAHFHDIANFTNSRFASEAMFSSAHFHNTANFTNSTFASEAMFSNAHFHGTANFTNSTFDSKAMFSSSHFYGEACFHEAELKSVAHFEHARFDSNAVFTRAEFGAATSFKAARFKKSTNFTEIKSRSSFSFVDVKFYRVPRVIDADFGKPPAFDGMKPMRSVEPGGLLRSMFRPPDGEVAVCHRLLKNYAIQAGDYRSEQLFFRGELRSRRNRQDKFWHPAFWLGIGYELFSDLGRSLARPVVWWIALTAASALFYYSPHWTTQTANCIAGKGNPQLGAALLALKKGSIFGGLDTPEKANQIYACLYGVTEGYSAVNGVKDMVPTIPDWVVLWGIVQTTLSAALIFLFLLALRNHFRIR